MKENAENTFFHLLKLLPVESIMNPDSFILHFSFISTPCITSKSDLHAFYLPFISVFGFRWSHLARELLRKADADGLSLHLPGMQEVILGVLHLLRSGLSC